jgi:hypothetical protein
LEKKIREESQLRSIFEIEYKTLKEDKKNIAPNNNFDLSRNQENININNNFLIFKIYQTLMLLKVMMMKTLIRKKKKIILPL